MREAGVAHVRARHDWSRNVARYLSVYHALLTNLKRRDGHAIGAQEQGLAAQG